MVTPWWSPLPMTDCSSQPHVAERGQESSAEPFSKGLIPLVRRAPPSCPNHPPKVPPPNTRTLGIRILTCECLRGRELSVHCNPLDHPFSWTMWIEEIILQFSFSISIITLDVNSYVFKNTSNDQRLCSSCAGVNSYGSDTVRPSQPAGPHCTRLLGSPSQPVPLP